MTLFTCLSAQDQSVPVLTVCEVMKDLAALNGKTIIVVGRLGSTMERGVARSNVPGEAGYGRIRLEHEHFVVLHDE